MEPCNVVSRFLLIRSSFGSRLTESCFLVKLNPFVDVDPVRPFRRSLRTLDLHSRGYYSSIVKTGMAKFPSLILDDPGALRIAQGFLSVIVSRVCWAGCNPRIRPRASCFFLGHCSLDWSRDSVVLLQRRIQSAFCCISGFGAAQGRAGSLLAMVEIRSACLEYS